MILRTKVRDCLYLNWAFPADTMPPLPEPLCYQTLREGDRDWAFASALLFHHEGLRFRIFPLVRLSYPQLHLRHYVLDGDGRRAVYLRRVVVPFWMVPGVRLIGGQPALPGRIGFARPSRDPGAGCWRWSVRGRQGLEVVGERGAPGGGAGPRLGTWRQTVRFFRERHRAYSGGVGGLRMMETTQPDAAIWPMRIELENDTLARRGLAVDELPPLHSSWLCPEVPMTFELAADTVPEEPVRRSVPAAG